jgi:hypothetical protein
MDIAELYNWNVICQICRKKIKASQSLKRWDGLIVCKDDFELRHSLDMPQPLVREQRPLPFTSPEPEDQFVTMLCSTNGRSCLADYAEADCSILGNTIVSVIPSGTFREGTL